MTCRKWSWSSFFLAIVIVTLAMFVYHHAKSELAASGSQDPASIEKRLDFSALSGSALEDAAKRRLLESVQIDSESDSALIQVGNFVVLNDLKEREFACGYYDRVTVRFQAEGIAVSGAKPTLILEAPCAVSANNIAAFEPIKVPFKKIRELKPEEQELQFSNDYLAMPANNLRAPSSGYSLRVQMTNAPSEWPTKWTLTDLRLSHSQAAHRALHLRESDIKEFTNKPILMNW